MMNARITLPAAYFHVHPLFVCFLNTKSIRAVRRVIRKRTTLKRKRKKKPICVILHGTIELNRIICLVHILGSPSRHDERRGRKRQGSLSKSHPWIYFPKLEDEKKKIPHKRLKFVYRVIYFFTRKQDSEGVYCV